MEIYQIYRTEKQIQLSSPFVGGEKKEHQEIKSKTKMKNEKHIIQMEMEL